MGYQTNIRKTNPGKRTEMQHLASPCYSAERPVEHFSSQLSRFLWQSETVFFFPSMHHSLMIVGATLCIYTEGRKNILHLIYPTEESGSYKRTAQGKPYFPFYQM